MNRPQLPILDILDKEKIIEQDAKASVEYLMKKYNCSNSDAMILITGYVIDKMNELFDDPTMERFLNSEMPE